MGGGGSPDTITQTNKTEPPAWATPYYTGFLNQAQQISQQPYQAYPGQQIAGWNPSQLTAQQMQTNRALQGSPTMRAANQQLTSTLMGGGAADFGQNPYMGREATVGRNQYAGLPGDLYGQTADVGTNKFAGSNPYLGQMIGSAQEDVTRSFNQNVVPQTLSQFAKGGAFGGTAMQEAVNQQQRTLGDQLGDISTQFRSEDYNRQAQLAEADINRRLGASESQLARDVGLYGQAAGLSEADIARRLQAQQTDLSRNAGLGEADLQRQLEAYNAERGRQLQAAFQAPAMAQSDYFDAQQLAGVGNAQQQLQQQLLSQEYNNWLQQLGYPQQQLGIMGNALNVIGGNYQTGSATGPNPNQSNPWMGALGGAATGYALGAGAGAAAGAASGATTGSAFGPWGALIGAGLGYALS